MKRNLNISLLFVLAIFIAWMGTGKTMLTCLHSETTRMLMFSDMCGGGCDPGADCMLTEQVSLSPLSPASSVDFDFHAPVFDLPLFIAPQLPEQLIVRYAPVYTEQKWGSPPRDWLTKISVLRL